MPDDAFSARVVHCEGAKLSTPILVISDCPSQSSGLARITRDLCTLIATMPEFRVATLGWMGTGSHRLPFHTYHMHSKEFGELSLPSVWDEWSQGEAGIVLTIWDLSRLLWLARPEFCEIEETKKWLEWARGRKFSLWGYVPVDSTGPNNRLTAMSAEVLTGMDRVLAYSPFAEGIIRNTIGNEAAEYKGIEWAPHGINTKVFAPGPVEKSSVPLIGAIGTNQSRKNWGLVASTCAGLVEHFKGNVKLWWHLDRDVNYWNIQALVTDFQLGEYVEVTYPPQEDHWLVEQYRKCDVTLHPGNGEGFGYGIFESLACGTPAIHGDYAGGASILNTCGLVDLLVQPRAWYLEGQFNCLRPVFDPRDWVEKVVEVLGRAPQNYSASVEHLGWNKLATVWKKWLREGLGNE